MKTLSEIIREEVAFLRDPADKVRKTVMIFSTFQRGKDVGRPCVYEHTLMTVSLEYAEQAYVYGLFGNGGFRSHADERIFESRNLCDDRLIVIVMHEEEAKR